MEALQAFADGISVASRPLRFFGVEMGTKMTVVRLESGGLFVHSPIALDPALREAVDAMGPVRAIVAPTRFHHLFVPAWREAYPDARLYACPGLPEKRPDVTWDHVLGDEPEPLWDGELAQVLFGARSLENEIVFFHPRTRTIISSDLIFNLSTHPAWFTRVFAWLAGNRTPGATHLERILIRDRAAARAQVDRMLAWDFDRIQIAHGEPILEGGREVLQRAYGWL